MAEGERLKLGKGVAFVKSRLKRLAGGNEIWETDFQALPRPIMQDETHYIGMVVDEDGGSLLADLPVRGRPSVNDRATLLAKWAAPRKLVHLKWKSLGKLEPGGTHD